MFEVFFPQKDKKKQKGGRLTVDSIQVHRTLYLEGESRQAKAGNKCLTKAALVIVCVSGKLIILNTSVPTYLNANGGPLVQRGKKLCIYVIMLGKGINR